MDFETWWKKEYEHLALGFHAKGSVKIGFEAGKTVPAAQSAPAGVVELLKQFAELPIGNYHYNLNNPHVVTLIREARKILSVSPVPAPDSAEAFNLSVPGANNGKPFYAEQALGKLRDKAHPNGYPESAPVAPVEPCPACLGHGVTDKLANNGLCPACNGTGKAGKE